MLFPFDEVVETRQTTTLRVKKARDKKTSKKKKMNTQEVKKENQK